MDPEPTAQDASPAPSDSNQHSHLQDEYSRTKKSKFRFKTSSSKSKPRHHSRNHDSDHNDSHRHSRKRPGHHQSHHHRRSKRHRPKRSSPDPDIDEQQPGSVSPNTAFRESLFDALADDEGADYWQTIYGQPIHTYANPSVPHGPGGELEQMTEDEYAAYVRTRMWERTREGMIEMQERERAERRERERRERKYDEGVRERVRFEKAIEESLARGEGRRKGRVWKEAGREYLGRWERLPRGDDNGAEGKSLAEMIFWPVQSGKRRDISRDAVEQFMRHALVPLSESGSEIDKDALLPGVLKAERVRWHPDKIQHRHGALGVDEDVMRSVTEVFQIIDLMWNEVKEKQR